MGVPAKIPAVKGRTDLRFDFSQLDDAVMLDADEFAALLRISRWTPAMWRQRKQGPKFVRIGNRIVRYKVGDIRAWLAATG